MANLQDLSNTQSAETGFRLFRTDPGWYQAHWYQEQKSTGPHLLSRAFSALAALGVAMMELRRFLAATPPEFDRALETADVVRVRHMMVGDTPEIAPLGRSEPVAPSGDQPCQQHEDHCADGRDGNLLEQPAAQIELPPCRREQPPAHHRTQYAGDQVAQQSAATHH